MGLEPQTAGSAAGPLGQEAATSEVLKTSRVRFQRRRSDQLLTTCRTDRVSPLIATLQEDL